MSILVIEVTSDGIIFGGDRNVTTTHADKTTTQEKQTEKVLKWSNDKALIGFVGNGRIDNKSTTEWINEFINKNLDFSSLKEVADKLCSEVQAQRKIDEGQEAKARGMIIHIGGFVISCKRRQSLYCLC